jgi:hypothetical protein
MDEPLMEEPVHPKNIVIIGAGAAGMVSFPFTSETSRSDTWIVMCSNTCSTSRQVQGYSDRAGRRVWRTSYVDSIE